MQELIIRTLIRAVVLMTALPVHEAAHAWVADKLGDPTGRYQGRITLNPFAHLDLIGSMLILVTGFGWAKPVPVNAGNFRNPKRGMALTAAAGPLSNIAMAFILMIVYKIVVLFLPYTTATFYVEFILQTMLTINLGLAVFNLLPIPPLDGSRLAALFLPERTYFRIMQYERYIFLFVILLLVTNVLDTPINFLMGLLWQGLYWLTYFVDLLAMVL